MNPEQTKTVLAALNEWSGIDMPEQTLYDIVWALARDPAARLAMQDLVRETWREHRKERAEVARLR